MTTRTTSPRHDELMRRPVRVQRFGRTVAGIIIDTVISRQMDGSDGSIYVGILPRAAQDVEISGQWIPLSEVEFEDAPAAQSTATPAPVKEIVYDRETRDYALYLGGELVGFAATCHEGEVKLDRLAFEQLAHAAPDLVCARPAEEAEPVEVRSTAQVETCGCGAPATITIRENRTLHHVCDSCFQVEFEQNTENYAGWEVVYTDDLHIPASRLDGQCGDCGSVLDSQGLCGCRELDEQDASEIQAVVDRPRTLTFHPGGAFRMSAPSWGS